MNFLANLDLPVVDGTALTPPEEGYVTVFQSTTGLCLLYPNGTIVPIAEVSSIGTMSLNLHASQRTDDLLQEMVSLLKKIRDQLIYITEEDI